MDKITEIFQALIKVFVRSNKRFPAGKELQDLERQAKEVFDGALTYNLDQSKGKNLDDITVMEQTTEKNADQLIDDYLSNEANKVQPTFSVVDERKLPRAEIEALPLKDREKAEAAVKKKIEAQNVQATQAKQGGETPGGPQRGRPEVVDESYGQTVYVDKREMEERMRQAFRQFEAAEEALSAGKTDEARGILRYEIEENYKFPKNVRDAAADARYMIIRGEGIDAQDFDSLEEATEELREKIQIGKNQTSPDNYPDMTDPLEGEPQNIEYVSFFDEPGEDFGTPNSVITDIDKLDFKEGGVVNTRQAYLFGGPALKYIREAMRKARKRSGVSKGEPMFQRFSSEIKEKMGKDIVDTPRGQYSIADADKLRKKGTVQLLLDELKLIENIEKQKGITGIPGEVLEDFGKKFMSKDKETASNAFFDFVKTMSDYGIGGPGKSMDDMIRAEKGITIDGIEEARGALELYRRNLEGRKLNAEGGLNYLLGF